MREYSVDPFQLLRVGELMVRDVDILRGDMSAKDATSFFSTDEPRHKSYPITDAEGRVLGMVSRADIRQWRMELQMEDEMLFDRLSDSSVLVGYADETISNLADRISTHDIGCVSVV